VTSHPRRKNYGDRTPPGACVTHSGTPAALPRGDALFSEQGPGIVVVVSREKMSCVLFLVGGGLFILLHHEQKDVSP